jgi:hypothetical protein
MARLVGALGLVVFDGVGTLGAVAFDGVWALGAVAMSRVSTLGAVVFNAIAYGWYNRSCVPGGGCWLMLLGGLVYIGVGLSVFSCDGIPLSAIMGLLGAVGATTTSVVAFGVVGALTGAEALGAVGAMTGTDALGAVGQ